MDQRFIDEFKIVLIELRRIADRLETMVMHDTVLPARRGVFDATSHPPPQVFFGDASTDPIDFIMTAYGETREDAERIVANCRAVADDDDEKVLH